MRQLKIPGLTSHLANGDVNSTLNGVNDLQREYEAKYVPGNYKPLLPVATGPSAYRGGCRPAVRQPVLTLVIVRHAPNRKSRSATIA